MPAPLVANVALHLDGTQPVNELNKVTRATDRLQRTSETANQKINAGLKGVARSVRGLKDAFSGLSAGIAAVGLTAFAKDVASAGIEADRTAKRILNLAGNAEEAAKIQQIAGRAAKEFGLGNMSASQGVADLYGRLSPMGIALKDIETVFVGANKAGLQMGLTSEGMSNVMLQLSQALGSGVLQGDEFRSISEQMPAILQAVANVLQVERGELKQLASQGKVTTQVLIQAMQQLQRMNTVKPDAARRFNAAMENLRVTIGTKLLPALTPMIEGLTALLNAFNALPGPIQSLVVGVGAIGAVIGILGPVIAGIATVFGTVGPAIVTVVSAVSALVSALGGLSGIMTGVVAFFSGPVGWVALLIGAGVALFQFRDQIGEFILSVGALFNSLREAMIGPFKALGEIVKGVFNGIIGVAENMVNRVIETINKLINGVNKVSGVVGIPPIELIPEISIPRLAKGGYVDSPQLAMIGEGSEPEYVIPESKMNRAMMRYSAGSRGESVVAGDVAAGSANSTANYSSQQNAYYGGGGTSVNITTGPVLRMNNKNYVSVSDMQRGMAAAVGAAEANMMNRMSRSYAVRRSMGL